MSAKGRVKLRKIPLCPEVVSCIDHYFLVSTNGRVFRKWPDKPMWEMDNPDYDDLFVHSETMSALKDYRKFLMSKLNDLQRVEEIMDEVKHQAEIKRHREENDPAVEGE
jgi:hypothetical protein